MGIRLTGAFCLAATVVIAAALAACTNEEPRRDIIGTETKLYSQFDEELLIRDFFQDKRDGVFVDIGCAWPKRGSTTYYLEKYLGWSGIAVDALPQYRAGWERSRPNSKFLDYAITDHSGDKITFFKHDWPGVSSMSKEQAAQWGGEEHVTEIEVETITLTDLLVQQGITKIDHLTIDIEGAEPGALAGFDIERFKPELICIEGGRVNGDLYLEYFGAHGYEQIESYLEHDEINWYFRRAQ